MREAQALKPVASSCVFDLFACLLRLSLAVAAAPMSPSLLRRLDAFSFRFRKWAGFLWRVSWLRAG